MENRKIIQYETLVSKKGPDDNLVNQMISKGWQPYGPPAHHIAAYDEHDTPRVRWVQTMVRYSARPID